MSYRKQPASYTQRRGAYKYGPAYKKSYDDLDDLLDRYDAGHHHSHWADYKKSGQRMGAGYPDRHWADYDLPADRMGAGYHRYGAAYDDKALDDLLRKYKIGKYATGAGYAGGYTCGAKFGAKTGVKSGAGYSVASPRRNTRKYRY